MGHIIPMVVLLAIIGAFTWFARARWRAYTERQAAQRRAEAAALAEMLADFAPQPGVGAQRNGRAPRDVVAARSLADLAEKFTSSSDDVVPVATVAQVAGVGVHGGQAESSSPAQAGASRANPSPATENSASQIHGSAAPEAHEPLAAHDSLADFFTDTTPKWKKLPTDAPAQVAAPTSSLDDPSSDDTDEVSSIPGTEALSSHTPATASPVDLADPVGPVRPDQGGSGAGERLAQVLRRLPVEVEAAVNAAPDADNAARQLTRVLLDLARDLQAP